MSEVWTPEYEMTYWDNVRKDKHVGDLLLKYRYFDVQNNIAKHLTCDLDKVLDIGGGEYGGSLYFYKDGKERILFDFLADTFRQRGKLDKDIKTIQGSFDNLPFADNSLSVVFCWEALDHSQNIEMYRKAQKEMERVLAVGGLLFFECPNRPAPQTGHPVAVNPEQIAEGFTILNVIMKNNGNIANGNRTVLILKKG